MRAKRKRSRTSTLESEIRASAREIHATGMQEAMRAAAYIVCAKKLDEIKAVLTAAGLAQNPAQSHAGRGSFSQPGIPVGNGNVPSAPQVQHPCTYCGAESVYRTRANRFNRTGTWLCRTHLPLRRQHEQTATTDPQVLDASGASPLDVPQEVVLAPEKKDTGGDVTVNDAFAALGVN